MPMGHRTRRPVPMPGNSRADTNIGSSRVVSGTTCPRKLRRPLPRRSSMSTLPSCRHPLVWQSSSRLSNCSATRPICHVPTQRRTVMQTQTHEITPTAIRPFRFNVPEEEMTDLRRRINATRWPERETVADASQGVQLATTQELARYWGSDYDFRRLEAQLNALPQFMTEIDGLDIHFI